jgi:hypothetical protein
MILYKKRATESVGGACRGGEEDRTLCVLGVIICLIMDVVLWGVVEELFLLLDCYSSAFLCSKVSISSNTMLLPMGES